MGLDKNIVGELNLSRWKSYNQKWAGQPCDQCIGGDKIEKRAGIVIFLGMYNLLVMGRNVLETAYREVISSH